MGYMRHHAIIVTSWNIDVLTQAHAKAREIMELRPMDVPPYSYSGAVSPVTDEATNGYHSFFIAPDGSNVDWPVSDEGSRRRSEYIEYLKSTCYDDGSGPLAWVEVQFGDDEGVSKVTRHSDETLKIEA